MSVKVGSMSILRKCALEARTCIQQQLAVPVLQQQYRGQATAVPLPRHDTPDAPPPPPNPMLGQPQSQTPPEAQTQNTPSQTQRVTLRRATLNPRVRRRRPVSISRVASPGIYEFSVEKVCGRIELRATQRVRRANDAINWSTVPASEELQTVTIPRVWLRDHCQCPSCVRQDTKQKLLNTFNEMSVIEKCELDDSKVHVTWQGGHKSEYCLGWIRRAFTEPMTTADRQGYTKAGQWSSDNTFSHFTEVHYKDVMNSEKGLAEWMLKLRKFGFCFIEGCPPTPEATQELLARIGPIRNTHWGAFWDFTSNLASKDTAYTTEALDVHTDTNYFTDSAGLQMFHLLSHEGTGGETVLVDGFRAARLLQQRDAVAYDALSKQKMFFHSSGDEGVSIQPQRAYPTLLHEGPGGMLSQVRWNNADRGAFFMDSSDPKSLPRLESWYRAAKLFNRILNLDDPSLHYEVQLRPGRPLIFDNWRVLHGRKEFSGARRMCGGYINRDDYISKFRTTNYGYDEVLKGGVY